VDHEVNQPGTMASKVVYKQNFGHPKSRNPGVKVSAKLKKEVRGLNES
jgi:hypothetical protein